MWVAQWSSGGWELAEDVIGVVVVFDGGQPLQGWGAEGLGDAVEAFVVVQKLV